VTKEQAERLGWRFFGDESSFQTGEGWTFYSDSTERLVQTSVNQFRKEVGHVVGRKYVDGSCIEEGNSTIEGLLADISEHESRQP
jgi:hypothetical protein